MKIATLTSVLLCAGIQPALAQDSLRTPVTAELVEGWRQADGTQVTGLRLTLAPGWKTYWRTPGDAGIPPEFDWTGSGNLDGVAVSWPTPEVFDQSGMRSIGYSDQVILPLHVRPQRDGQPVTVVLSVDIGVCHDICIPKTLTVSATLAASGGTPTPAIAAALAERPYTAAEAGADGATCSVRPKAGGLEITARLSLPDTGGQEVVVIEPGRTDIWVSEADTKRSGNTLTATADMVSVDGKALALDRSAIKFTVLGKRHAVELLGCTAG